jgi:hypothetical protein
MNEPIYRQVQRDLEGRANSGKEQYGEHLTANTKIDGLQYLYEELLDGSNYIRKAMEDRRRLLEYVGRLLAYKNKLKAALNDAIGGEPIDHDPEFKRIKYVEFQVRRDKLEEYKALLAADPCATSPLAGQPQPAPATGWRPIAEAEDGVKLDVVGQHTKAVKSGWLRGLGYYKAEAIRDGFTYFFMYPAPPQEGE